MSKAKFKNFRKTIVIQKTFNLSGAEVIDFYLVVPHVGRAWLFQTGFSKGVFEYFQAGRSESELYEFKRLDHNPRLTKTIDRLLNGWIDYAMAELTDTVQGSNRRRNPQHKAHHNCRDVVCIDLDYDLAI